MHKRRVKRRVKRRAAIQHDLTLRERRICLCTHTDFVSGHYLKIVRCCLPVLSVEYSIAEQYVWRMDGERYVAFSLTTHLLFWGRGCFVSISSLSIYILSEIIGCRPIYLANSVSRIEIMHHAFPSFPGAICSCISLRLLLSQRHNNPL
jgi:hypothetical protein